MTSGIIMAIGTFLLSTLDASTPRWSITIYMMVIGLGVGPSFSVLGMASLQKALPQQRGIASSTSNFLRSLGMTLGITVFGVIQRNSFTDNLPATMPEGGAESGSILSPEARAHIPADILKQITDVLSDSISTTFLWTFIPLLLSFVFILSMTNEKITDSKLNQQG